MRSTPRPATVCTTLAALLLFSLGAAAAPALKLLLPQGRTAFQTNERIDLSVLRTDTAALPAADLTLVVTGAGSRLTFTFPLKAAALAGDAARATDHLHLNGWLLRPGTYTVEARAGEATAQTTIELFSHLRKSSYRTIHWGGPAGDGMKGEGEDGLGFNLMLGGIEEQSIREKMDIMGVCTMGGMHQHDGNLECDWSDPYVYIGAIQRGMDRAQSFRTMPNAIGAHLHDEPGLTWMKHPRTGDFNDHDIPPQRAAWQRAHGQEAIWWDQTNTSDPAQLAQWTQYNDFKLGFMDAFWKASRDSFERLKPGFLAVTQSQYGWTALYDGYYFNVARSLPVISGHGGYAHFWLWNMNPSFFLEFSLPRQLDKPTWYLPGWGEYTSEQVRLEQYMSFITGIQGLSQPPMVRATSRGAPAIKETNQVAARLGTIFAKPAYTGQAVAVLYSKSNAYFLSKTPNRQPACLAEVYMVTRLMQTPISAILDEDILDGTLAGKHKAVIVTGVDYLDAGVIAALADFAGNGGVVVVTDDVKVQIPGAVKAGFAVPDFHAVVVKPALDKIQDAKEKQAAQVKLDNFAARVKFAQPMARQLKDVLAKNGVSAPFGSDVDTIAAGRQVRGEIEYIFAVNFTVGEQPAESSAGQPGPVSATITLPDDGRPVYEAVAGAPAPFQKKGKELAAKIEFAAGDLKAFARTARPIGGVRVAAPGVNWDLTREQAPVRLEFAAALVDQAGQILSGTAPLQITVADPAGTPRFDLYRATDHGVCSLSLPLAANDPAGTWTVTVKELLSGTQGQARFEFQPLTRCRTVAGAGRRAAFFPDDKPNIYRFFRDQRNVTIAIGTGAWNQAAAVRLADALKPYNVTCTIVNAADIKARELTAEEARTWCGTSIAGKAKPGRENAPQTVGWDLPQPAIVLGSPADNPLLKHMADRKVLPYQVGPEFPGPGRGLLAWNLQTLGHDVQAIACVATDADGMAEAVGTLFELAVGLDPQTPLVLPATAVIEAVK